MEAADYTLAKLWLDIIQLVFTGAVALYAWLSTRHRATNDAIDRVEQQSDEKIEALKNRIDEHRDRLTSAEEQLRHFPTSKDMGEVHYRVDQVGQGVTGLQGEMRQINNTLDLILQKMMERES